MLHREIFISNTKLTHISETVRFPRGKKITTELLKTNLHRFTNLCFISLYFISNEMRTKGLLLSIMHMLSLHRYVATDIPSDFLVQIGDVSFHLHKVLVFFIFV